MMKIKHVLYRNRIVLILLLTAMAVIQTNAGDYLFDSEGNIRFGWKLKDEVGTYSVAGTRIFGEVEYVDTNPLYALLTLKGWSTKANTSYYAYAPYDTRYVTEGRPITALPISYSGQKQIMNNDATHLTAYDFMMAKYTTGATTADIQLSHVGCVVRMEWQLESDAICKSMTLTADEPLFVTEATMSLPDCSVTPTTILPTFTLELDDIAADKGQSLVTYFMLYPLDITNKTIKATLLTTDGKQYESVVKGGKLLAGMSYPVTFGTIGSGGGETYSSTAVSTPPVSTLASPSVTATDFIYDTDHPLNGNMSTGILEIEKPTVEGRLDSEMYTIYGIRISRPVKNGLYIYKGKKYVHHTTK